MALNLFAGLLIVLIYLPIFMYALISKKWNTRFMMVHSKTTLAYLNEAFAGILYFVITMLILTKPFTQNMTYYLLGACIYLCSIIITYAGYYTFYITKEQTVITLWPYSFSRNPTYFFGMLGIFGVIIMVQWPVLYLLLVAQFFVTHEIILSEEEYCRTTYSQKYVQYQKKVRRYI